MPAYALPGVYREQTLSAAPTRVRSGVPAFIGYAEPVAAEPVVIPLWSRFGERFGIPPGYLGNAVRAFFANGGSVCHVVALPRDIAAPTAYATALDALAELDAVDLICAPDIVWRPGATASDAVSEADAYAMLALQAAVMEHCEALGDRFALLDSLPALAVGDIYAGGVLWQRAARASDMAALYYPWIVPGPGADAVPPCGHVAGVIARLDTHRAPANVPLQEAIAVQATLGRPALSRLHAGSVNAVRALPGRGIRVWGARTLSAEAAWRHVTVRRLVIELGRWAREALEDFPFEPNAPALWRRITLATEVRLEELFRDGALAGATPAESFYVNCRGDEGEVVVEVGLAPATPNEFVVVHIVRDASGVSVESA